MEETRRCLICRQERPLRLFQPKIGKQRECPHKHGISAKKTIEELKSRIYRVGRDHIKAKSMASIKEKLVTQFTKEELLEFLMQIEKSK